MANYNRVILVGNLIRDPELTHTPAGLAVCKFGLAINRKWKDKEETCYVDLAAFGKTADILAEHTAKGRPLLVEGRLDYSTWQAQDGSKRSKLSVIVERFEFIGGRQERIVDPAEPNTWPDDAAPGGDDWF